MEANAIHNQELGDSESWAKNPKYCIYIKLQDLLTTNLVPCAQNSFSKPISYYIYITPTSLLLAKHCQIQTEMHFVGPVNCIASLVVRLQ